jgi:ABC-type transport system involved in cytochrome bd biosynthesis fused ATPase/permease subunit
VAVPLGLRLIGGSIGLAPALAVLVIAPEVFLPLRKASAEFHESSEGLAAALDAYSTIDASAPSPGPTGADGTRAPDPQSAPVRLISASYVFPGSSRPVLDCASLEIEPRETVVVVGANGVGKSTLLSVFLGLVAPDTGKLEVADRDLRGIDQASWRSHLAFLPDRPALLAATLAENLRIADPGASDDEIVEALGAVGAAHMLTSMPRGLETPIGEGGRPVSAGERQRIGLARIMLRDASLYVLDEPTVHLDSEVEQEVIEALRRRLACSSALVVTHRLAPVSLADRVLEMHDGKLHVLCDHEKVRT